MFDILKRTISIRVPGLKAKGLGDFEGLGDFGEPTDGADLIVLPLDEFLSPTVLAEAKSRDLKHIEFRIEFFGGFSGGPWHREFELYNVKEAVDIASARDLDIRVHNLELQQVHLRSAFARNLTALAFLGTIALLKSSVGMNPAGIRKLDLSVGKPQAIYVTSVLVDIVVLPCGNMTVLSLTNDEPGTALWEPFDLITLNPECFDSVHKLLIRGKVAMGATFLTALEGMKRLRQLTIEDLPSGHPSWIEWTDVAEAINRSATTSRVSVFLEYSKRRPLFTGFVVKQEGRVSVTFNPSFEIPRQPW